jgi:pimeloyl-ACP methyl ester carboxylesterase
MIRFWRGLLSTLSGVGFPLGNWWCNKLAHLKDEPRRSKGLIVILPGVEGRSSLSVNIAKGLADSGLQHAIEILDWTTGFWPLFLYHLRAFGRAKRKAKQIAARIQQYLNDFPDKPVILIGQSGGAAEAVFVLESLPMQSAISGAILLGPAISPAYDLTNALKKTQQGIWNFYSPFDLLILTLGTTLFGTLDSRHSVSAGAWGFSCPRDLTLEQRDLYKHQLHQVRYDPRMIASWHAGGHFGWANRLFVADWLAPILAHAANLPHGHGCQSPQLAKYC